MATTKYKDLNSLPPIWEREDKQEWVIEGFIPKKALTVFTGATGSGKSSVLLAAAYAIAQGADFLNHKTVQSQVLFIDRENPLYVYLERFARFDIKPTDNIKFWGIWDDELEPQGPDYIGIEKYVEEHQPVIIFDSLVAFHPESEQDASETRRYMQLFRRLTAKGATVIVIHHVGKGNEGQNKFYRGSSDIPANADAAWLLEQRPGKPLQNMHLTHYKSREGILTNIHFGLDGTQFVLTEFIEDSDPLYLEIDKVLTGIPPGVLNQGHICELLPHVSRTKLFKMLSLGVGKGRYRISKGLKNASFYSLGAQHQRASEAVFSEN